MQLPIRDQLQCMHLHLKIHEYIELFTWIMVMVSNEKVTRDFKISNSSYDRTSFVLGSTGHDSFCIMIVGSN